MDQVMSESAAPRRAKALAALHGLADLQARREWSRVYTLTGSVAEANAASRSAWYDTMHEIRQISEQYVVRY